MPINRCFPFCFDTFKAKVQYRTGENGIDEKQKNFEDLLKSKYYNIEDVIKIKDKDYEILESKSIILDHKIKQDYDEKYLYTPLSTDTKVGDIYYWVRTKTHWIVYAQYRTEKSYYKTVIKKANWCIAWKNALGGIEYQWVYVRGPVETKINDTIIKNKVIDIPNGTLTILMPNNSKTSVFAKYSNIMLNGKKWQVAADIDDISNPDLIELQLIKSAVDYNDDKDNNIIDGLMLPDVNFEIMLNDNVQINSTIDVNDVIVLYNNGRKIENDFSIKLISGTAKISKSKIKFTELGDCEFKVVYNLNKNINKVIKISVIEEAQNLLNKIIGSNQAKTLFGYKYSTNIINDSDIYEWKLEDVKHIVQASGQDNNEFKIQIGRKSGLFKILLYVNGTKADEMTVTVKSAFE